MAGKRKVAAGIASLFVYAGSGDEDGAASPTSEEEESPRTRCKQDGGAELAVYVSGRQDLPPVSAPSATVHGTAAGHGLILHYAHAEAAASPEREEIAILAGSVGRPVDVEVQVDNAPEQRREFERKEQEVKRSRRVDCVGSGTQTVVGVTKSTLASIDKIVSVMVVCCIVSAAAAIPLSGDPVGNLTSSLTSKKSQGGTRRVPASCGTANPIDSCWMCDPEWRNHRQRLADCAVGFGHKAVGGRSGNIYTVTDSGNDNPEDPKYGTLRWGVTRSEPLWIVFQRDMKIQLKEELIVTSFKTIDGRGTNVHIGNGACITIQGVKNVIVHGIYFSNCMSTGPARIMSSESHVGDRGKTDGDAISIFESTDIWIDHNSFESCADGLVDVVEGSDSITISNNEFRNHDKVMLLGGHDSDYRDRKMKVTVCFNKFGVGLTERMPRCRLGSFHVFNNWYSSGWRMYAIGGSGNPIINSEGNYFDALDGEKEVTKHLEAGGDYRSSGDLFVNGAYFTPSGASTTSPLYARAKSFSAFPASQVPRKIKAGPTS